MRRLWRRDHRVRLHLAQDGRVLDVSAEGVLVRQRGGFYVLIDACWIDQDGDAAVPGELEVPVSWVLGREVRR